jgi:hypothetical protein
MNSSIINYHIDDLLFSRYWFNGDRKYLDQMVEKYPHGDRIDEAKFLLQQL